MHVLCHMHPNLQAQHQRLRIQRSQLHQQASKSTSDVRKLNSVGVLICLLLLARFRVEESRIDCAPVHLTRLSGILQGVIREWIRMRSLSIPSFLRDNDLATGKMVDVRFGLLERDPVVFGFGRRMRSVDGVCKRVAFALRHCSRRVSLRCERLPFKLVSGFVQFVQPEPNLIRRSSF